MSGRVSMRSGPRKKPQKIRLFMAVTRPIRYAWLKASLRTNFQVWTKSLQSMAKMNQCNFWTTRSSTWTVNRQKWHNNLLKSCNKKTSFSKKGPEKWNNSKRKSKCADWKNSRNNVSDNNNKRSKRGELSCYKKQNSGKGWKSIDNSSSANTKSTSHNIDRRHRCSRKSKRTLRRFWSSNKCENFSSYAKSKRANAPFP